MSPELEDIRHRAQRITQGLSEADWLKAVPGKWSCAQIFEHLRLSFTATTAGLQKALQEGRTPASKATWLGRIKVLWVTRLGQMPSGRSSPKHTTPAGGLSLTALSRFYDALVAMDATLNDAERRFGRRVKLLDHPFLGPLDAAEWRRFHRTHARHHLRQAAMRIKQTGSGLLIASSLNGSLPDTSATPRDRGTSPPKNSRREMFQTGSRE